MTAMNNINNFLNSAPRLKAVSSGTGDIRVDEISQEILSRSASTSLMQLSNKSPLTTNPDESCASLETTYATEWTHISDPIVNFPDFLVPNEGGIQKYQSLFVLNQRGFVLSTGAERSLFTLLLCAKNSADLCNGLIVRDISRNVKMYVDFVVLLLRLTKDCNEFEEWSSEIVQTIPEEKEQEITRRIRMIGSRLDHDDSMNSDVKGYYCTNLTELANLYFGIPKKWKESPAYISYWKDKESFQILKRFARSGNIIATIGDIEDWRFLDNCRPAFLDISNIADYKLLSARYLPRGLPIIYLSSVDNQHSQYNRYVVSSPLSDEERQEVDQLLAIMQDAGVIDRENASDLKKVFYDSLTKHPILEKHPVGYFPELLSMLRFYKEHYLLEVSSLGWFCFFDQCVRINVNQKLLKLELSDIQKICEVPDARKIVEIHVRMWPYYQYHLDRFFAFSKIPGWNEAFLKEAQVKQNDRSFQCVFENQPCYTQAT